MPPARATPVPAHFRSRASSQPFLTRSAAFVSMLRVFHVPPALSRPKEGKFSFPIIHCIRAKPRDHRLLNILKQRTEDVDVKKHAVLWMKKTVRDEQRARGTSVNISGQQQRCKRLGLLKAQQPCLRPCSQPPLPARSYIVYAPP